MEQQLIDLEQQLGRLSIADTTAQQSHIIQPQPLSPLLALTAELKAIVWAFTVLQPTPVPIHVGAPTQPALLAVCRETYKDAGYIYWRENRFRYFVLDYSAAGARHAKRKSAEYGRTMPTKTSFVWRGNPHWANLLQWFRDFHARKARATSAPAGSANSTKIWVFIACFKLVKKGKDLGLPWEDVAEMLAPQREVLASIDGEWAVDK